MPQHAVVSREEWLAARQELLEEEQKHAQRSDLAHRDVSFVAVSPAPVERLHAYRERKGWGFPRVSFGDSDFNLEFAVFTEEAAPEGKGFNFGTAKYADLDLLGEELHGLSAFALEDGVVYHTYSSCDRGTDVLNATWQLLDRTPKGRGETFDGWPRRHDEYPD